MLPGPRIVPPRRFLLVENVELLSDCRLVLFIVVDFLVCCVAVGFVHTSVVKRFDLKAIVLYYLFLSYLICSAFSLNCFYVIILYFEKLMY